MNGVRGCALTVGRGTEILNVDMVVMTLLMTGDSGSGRMTSQIILKN